MIESDYLKGNDDLLQKVKTIPAFLPFEDTRLMQMLTLCKLRSYEAGERIMEEGAQDCWIYFLISGAVRVVKGGERIATLCQYGDMFGEMAVVDGHPRSATIIAEGKAICLALDGSIIDRIDNETEQFAFYSVLYRFIACVLSERLRQANDEQAKTKAELERCRAECLTLKAGR